MSPDAPDAPGAVAFFAVVPPGTCRAEPLVEAVAAIHPAWDAHAVWAGDPQLRSPIAGRWSDVEVPERELAQVDEAAVPWLVASYAIDQHAAGRPAVVAIAGSVAILGPIDELVATGDELVLVPRVIDGGPELIDHPPLADLAEFGAHSTSVVGFGPGTRDTVAWIRRELLAVEPPEHLGRTFDLAASFFPSRPCTAPDIGVSAWRWDADPPRLIDAPTFDPHRPWLLDPTLDGTPRVSVATPDRQAALASASSQLDGSVEPLRLPGGIEIDDSIRKLFRIRDDVPGRPWTDSAAVRPWIDENYWTSLYGERSDLQAEFPHPTGADAARFASWARQAGFEGRVPILVDPTTVRIGSQVITGGTRRDGVNLVGYFRHQSGVSNVGRRLAGILERQQVPFTTVAYERTSSPRLIPEPECDQRLDFESSLVFVNGDQFGVFHRDMPEVFGAGRRVVGLWSWELETVEGGPPIDLAHVDQIWATTSFMARPFRALDAVPVHVVHIPFTEPEPSDRLRSTFPPLADADGRFVFGAVLDHLSITGRKNPLGAIEAFRRAFAPDEGPLLVVKTINASICWQEHERLLAAAADRRDVVIWDEHLPRADHLAFIGALDALVSLHRSEGVGLHLAEAMWMRRPVVATRYSGNLDFMDDDSAVLIDAELVPVRDGGWAYPPTASWADPDLDQAAAALRRLVDDVEYARRIGEGARRKMQSMPGEQDLVTRMVELLDLDLPSS